MKFNMLANLKSPTDAKKARQFLCDLPNIIEGASVKGDVSSLSDEECIAWASKVFFNLASLPIFDDPEGEA